MDGGDASDGCGHAWAAAGSLRDWTCRHHLCRSRARNRLATQRAKALVAWKSSLLAQNTAKEATSPKPLDTSERLRMKTPGSGIPPLKVEVSAAIPAKGMSTRTASTIHSDATSNGDRHF